MKKQNRPQAPPGFRLQGTDGIRREVRPAASAEFKGLTPQQVFLDRGFITDEFMELYAYAHVDQLIQSGKMRPGDGFVVGWDPRDIGGTFTTAVIRGIRKAKGRPLVLGIVPTPLVPTFMLYRGAKGGFMITASHNPRDQNGIKTFLAFRGMKLLPDNDIDLTGKILSTDYASLKNLSCRDEPVDCRNEALDLFRRFSLLAENTWMEAEHAILLQNITLVVDPANGSLSGIAAEAFRQAGFGRVVEVNARLDGNVNLFSGVADLEGHTQISAAMIDKQSGHFRKHKAVLKLFELGRKLKPEILKGARRVSGAVFDADGDRFYRLDYDPFKDALLVLSGDETAFLQGKFLIARDPKRYQNALYINTVESDLNAAVAARKLGLKPLLTAVGDKWILLRAAFLIVKARMGALKKSTGRSLPPPLQLKWDAMEKKGTLNVHEFEKIENAIDAMEKKISGGEQKPGYGGLLSFAVGSEETGHNITPGRLDLDDGGHMPVFFGNGLKSALNTFAATEYLFRGKPARTYFSAIHHPFRPGFKETLYAYYIRKELFCKDSPVWKKVKQSILADARAAKFRGRISTFPEDPDMLYIALTSQSADKRAAGVFVRNSGTENKISVNLRGDKKDARPLQQIGENAIRLLLGALKDTGDHYYKLELDVLSQTALGPLPENKLILDERSRTRVLTEMGKQRLIELTPQGYRLTARGKWYINSRSANPDSSH